MITIGMPSTGTVRIETVLSLTQSLFTLTNYYKSKGKNIDFTLAFPVGCYIHNNRNHCAQEALDTGASHLFFVDADMEFPRETLVKLLEADKEIIGVPYNKRGFPIRPILDIRKEDMPNCLCRSNAMPTGLLLIRTEVFRKISQPWFAFEFVEGSPGWVGEDIYFCRKALTAGCEIWCDPTIKANHIGEYKY